MTLMRRAAVLLLLLMLEAALVAQAVTVPFNHDEHGYLVSGVLSGQYRLYTDFGYNHMPYLPLLFGHLWRWLGGEELLTVGRGLVAGFGALAGLALFVAARRLTRSNGWALACLALFTLNSFVVVSIGKAAKDYPAMALALCGFALFLYGLDPSRRWPFVLSGMALALAVGFKLTYGLFLAPLALVLAWQRRDALAPHAAGLALGLMPLFGLFLSDPAAFLFNNLDYHQLNTAWRAATGYPLAMDLPGKLVYLGQHGARDPSLAALSLGGVVLAGLAWRRRAEDRAPADRLAEVGLLAMLSVALVAAVSPTPSFPHHFTAAVPYGLLGLALLAGRHPRVGAAIFGGMLAVHLGHHGPGVGQALAKLPQPMAWTGAAFHQEARAVRLAVGDWRPGDRLVTLAPALALEAGLPIERDFSTGPFFFRVGDQVPPALRTRFHLVAPATLDAWLAAAPPRAILVGFESGWPAMGEPSQDAPLIRFAERRGYHRRPIEGSRAVLYQRPDSLTP